VNATRQTAFLTLFPAYGGDFLCPRLTVLQSRRCFVPFHHVTAAGTQHRALLFHARRNSINVRYVRTAEADGVAGTLQLRLGTEGKTCFDRCGNHSKCEYRTEAVKVENRHRGHHACE